MRRFQAAPSQGTDWLHVQTRWLKGLSCLPGDSGCNQQIELQFSQCNSAAFSSSNYPFIHTIGISRRRPPCLTCPFDPLTSPCRRNTFLWAFHVHVSCFHINTGHVTFSWRCYLVTLWGQMVLTPWCVYTRERNPNIWMLPCGRIKIDVSQKMPFFPPISFCPI